MMALQLLSSMIGEITNVFLNFNVEQQYVTIIIRLIVGKMFEYIVKLYLIGYSLPMIITLFELILSVV